MAEAHRRRPRILLVEDELLIALSIELMLAELGYAVVGPLARLDEALARARTEPLDGALLDVHLGSDDVFPVADVLAARGVPFVFATGYDSLALPDRFRDRPHLQKPFGPRHLGKLMAQVVAAAGPGG
jgi:CheY-like chemotaxis protein